MQTFLPDPSFIESAVVLDRQRLGKQRVEAKQILQTLSKGKFTCKHCKEGQAGYTTDICPVNTVHVWQPTAWYNHPAVEMWRGYEACLASYGYIIAAEWRRRGYKDTTLDFFQQAKYCTKIVEPPWMGQPEFHRSHRSNLLRKYPQHYRKYWPDERDDLPYVWPQMEIVK